MSGNLYKQQTTMMLVWNRCQTFVKTVQKALKNQQRQGIIYLSTVPKDTDDTQKRENIIPAFIFAGSVIL